MVIDGAERIAAERKRQIEEEGYTTPLDASHYRDDQLVRAAIAYARPDHAPVFWPWPYSTFKPTPDDRIRDLTKAGALIAAEIDRLQYAAPPEIEPMPNLQGYRH